MIIHPHSDTDGIQIELKINIDEREGSAVMDFTGTGCEIRGNLNAPESVVHSAIIYCMRSMLDTDIPLNAGCLVPLQSLSLHICLGKCLILLFS